MGSARGERVAATGGAAGLLLAAAVAGGMLAQGGFYPRAQWYLGLLLSAALLVALASRPLSKAELRTAPVLAGAGFAGWAVADGVAQHAVVDGVAQHAVVGGVAQHAVVGGVAQHAVADGVAQHAVAGGVRYALLVVGLLAALLAGRRLAGAGREALVTALLAGGVLLAGLGWLGVLLRRDGWAWQGDGLWRASSTLTYPNATAAVLAMLGLLCLALLAGTPRSVPYGLAATALLAGLA